MTPKMHQKKIQDAMDAYAKFLEGEAIRDLKKLAARYPGRRCIFCSAMGTYFWHVEDDEANVRARKLFDEAFDHFEFSVIPAPVKAVIDESGKLEVLRNW